MYEKYDGKKLPYGNCPICGQHRQPEFDSYDDMSYEFVACGGCMIIWTLHHDDIPLDDNDPTNVYRISDIESL